MNDPQQGAASHTAPASTDNNDRKRVIQKGFDTVAPGYDHPSLFFFPETARRMIEHLALEQRDQGPGLQWLDVCTGTGCITLVADEKP